LELKVIPFLPEQGRGKGGNPIIGEGTSVDRRKGCLQGTEYIQRTVSFLGGGNSDERTSVRVGKLGAAPGGRKGDPPWGSLTFEVFPFGKLNCERPGDAVSGVSPAERNSFLGLMREKDGCDEATLASKKPVEVDPQGPLLNSGPPLKKKKFYVLWGPKGGGGGHPHLP